MGNNVVVIGESHSQIIAKLENRDINKNQSFRIYWRSEKYPINYEYVRNSVSSHEGKQENVFSILLIKTVIL